MSGFNLDDYVDVAERIRLFYEKYPDGRLATVAHGTFDLREQEFVFCKAAAYRTPDDPQPCNGIAWEPVPGATPYTRQSELMNAETSAWGRAIIAAGIPSKKIASREEVQNRQGSQATGARADSRRNPGDDVLTQTVPASQIPGADDRPDKKAKLLAELEDTLSALQTLDGTKDWKTTFTATAKRNFGKERFAQLTIAQLGPLVEDARKSLAHAQPAEAPFL